MRAYSGPRAWRSLVSAANEGNLKNFLTRAVFIGAWVLAVHSSVASQEIDVTRLEKIGPVASFTKSDKGITLSCRDNSQVQLTVFAPDLVRVRASFAKPIPTQDHSWAIARQSWETPLWRLHESA